MNTKNTVISIALCGALALGGVGMLTGCVTDNAAKNASQNTNTTTTNTQATEVVEKTSTIITEVDPSDPYASGIHHAVLTVAGYEPIEIELNADAAPITVSNFANLVSTGYYDGLTFYRFQDGFCMQGGTAGNSASGNDPSLKSILGEFSGNGQDNPLADNFQRGTIAMARTTIPDSASSTFFITLASNNTVSASLNGQYAAFGTISPDGMLIVDQIVKDHVANAKDSMGMVNNKEGQAMIESITMID